MTNADAICCRHHEPAPPAVNRGQAVPLIPYLGTHLERSTYSS